MEKERTITDKINYTIKKHFNRYFKSQHIEPNQNEWSALRRAMKKLVGDEVEPLKHEIKNFQEDKVKRTRFIDICEQEMAKKDVEITNLRERLEVQKEDLIKYIENDAECTIPIERFFNEDGSHITKKKYGLILLEILCEELRSKK